MSDHTCCLQGSNPWNPSRLLDRPTTEERWRQRTASTMEEIRLFYDVMLGKLLKQWSTSVNFHRCLPEPSGG